MDEYSSLHGNINDFNDKQTHKLIMRDKTKAYQEYFDELSVLPKLPTDWIYLGPEGQDLEMDITKNMSWRDIYSDNAETLYAALGSSYAWLLSLLVHVSKAMLDEETARSIFQRLRHELNAWGNDPTDEKLRELLVQVVRYSKER